MTTLHDQPPIVLFVDDDLDARELLPRLIHSFAPQCEVVTVDSGAAALALMDMLPVALVITDYHMPEMNGVQLTRAIKGASPAIRVAIVSVDDTRDVARLAQSSAAEYVLPKPFVLAQLQQMIGESLPPAARVPG
jgi:CheY-like chemotaxis protein